jgi:glucose-6-phosphate dehydrogenase assembly protein OpcA
VEADLSALWRDVGGHGPIARAMMSNLVVFRRASGDEHRAPRRGHRDMAVDSVAARHPSRVVVIEHSATTAEAAESMAADVGIVAFGPPNARYGVERIDVRAACPTAWLPSLVRRVIRGDLPTSVWWAEDVSRHAPEEPIVAMGRQLVYDSRQWSDVRSAVLALQPYISVRDTDAGGSRRAPAASKHVDLADVNWRRLSPVRSALLVVAQSGDFATWRPGDIRIAHARGESALAWLLIGWLASRLDWPASAHPYVDEGRSGDEVLSIAVGAGADEIRAALDGRRVVMTRGGETRSVMSVRQEGEADAVAAELHALSHDACLHDALSALLRSFRAA